MQKSMTATTIPRTYYCCFLLFFRLLLLLTLSPNSYTLFPKLKPTPHALNR